jgi:CRISPR-associated protein Cas2
MNARFWLVCYDISHPKRLRRIAREIETHGDRVQKSVFECGLTTDSLFTLRARLRAQMDQASDKLMYVPVCAECRSRILWQGKRPPDAAEPFWIV